jgi:hypothetical protein
MKPTAPYWNAFSVFATTPGIGIGVRIGVGPHY